MNNVTKKEKTHKIRSHTDLVNIYDTFAATLTLLLHLCFFFFFELKATAVNVYQNETVNLILRKHAIKREEQPCSRITTRIIQKASHVLFKPDSSEGATCGVSRDNIIERFIRDHISS